MPNPELDNGTVLESSIESQLSTETEGGKVIDPQKKHKIFFDASFLLAWLDPAEPFYMQASSIMGFIEARNCELHLNFHVAAEVISKLVQKTKSVPKGLKRFDGLQNKLKKSGSYFASPFSSNIDELVKNYRSAGKKQTRLLQINDFIIVSGGMSLNGLILTCDIDMYKKVKSIYDKIYLICPNAKEYNDDIIRLIKQLTKYD